MSISDTLQYITLGNPISRALINSSSSIFRSMGLRPKKLPMDNMPMQPHIQPVSMRDLVGNNYNFVRIAGLCGASAICMGAYCSFYLRDVADHKKQVKSQAFADVANRLHFMHSFALMGIPLAHYPVFTGVLMTIGTALFSGCMYYRALTGKNRLQHYASIGAFCLIGAWLSLLV